MAELRLEGLDELLSNLQQLGEKAARVENQALRAGGEILREEMSRRAPRRTGKLAEDIQVSNVKQKEGIKYIEVGPGKETNWRAKFLEWGTSKMTAKPFMQPALIAKRNEIIAEMAAVIRGALKT